MRGRGRSFDAARNRCRNDVPAPAGSCGLGAKSPWDWKRRCQLRSGPRATPARPRQPKAAPRPPAPDPPATTPDLPDFAKKASDLEEIKKAVEDAASVSGALWFSYLFVLFYFAVAAGAVTHADLFFENPVRLPILSVDLPLLAFFFLAPILFVIIHAYILVHLVMLTDKAKRYHQALHQQIEDDAIRDGLRRQLPSNVFVQFLAGAPETREGPFGWMLRAIGWTTLVIGPVLLLLLIQIQFLPFHNSFITWTHRLALLADLFLIWWLWRRIMSGREVDGPRSRQLSRLSTTLGVTLSACALIASWALATFPGEWQEERLAAWKPIHEYDELDVLLRCPFTTGSFNRGWILQPSGVGCVIEHPRPARLERLRRPQDRRSGKDQMAGLRFSGPRPRSQGGDFLTRDLAEGRF